MTMLLRLTTVLLDVVAKISQLALRLDEKAMIRQLSNELDNGTLELHATTMGLDEEGCVCPTADCFARWYYRNEGAA